MDKSGIISLSLFALMLIIALIPTELRADQNQGPVFLDYNFAGGRIGVWSNTGDIAITGDSAELEFSNSSIYAEFFYAYRLWRPVALEFNLAIYSRGDVEYLRDSTLGTIVSSVNLYPIMVSAKIYPLYKFERAPIHFFIQPGIGLVIGTQNIIDYDQYYDYGYGSSETRAKITYTLGGGFDWPVADQIALTLSGRYVPVSFGKALARLNDYSGWTLTLGIGYIFK